jgi:O-acetylhomoserine/O-acetylserine sulfhydrylase-like pyridoxal-dependent enzyme
MHVSYYELMKWNLATRCAHAGASVRGAENKPFQEPIAQSTIFDLGTSATAETIFSGARKGYAYSRFGNPSVDKLAEVIAELEGGGGAVITSSGNAAVLCAVTAALEARSGPLVTHSDIYGGSFELLRILSSIHRTPIRVVGGDIQGGGRSGGIAFKSAHEAH